MALAATIVRIEVAGASVWFVGREFIFTSTIVPLAPAVSGDEAGRHHEDALGCAALPS
jgi:hypothetical protein